MKYVRTDAGIFVPKHTVKPAVSPIAVVFWHSRRLNRIVVGLPEMYPVPKVLVRLGFVKVVCRTAHEVEIWSQKMRDQEKRDEEMKDDEREAFEGPIRAALRSDLHERMANSRNPLNRQFCRQALARMDEYERKNRMKRESFMHAEAHEDGK